MTIPKHKRFFSINGHEAETLIDLKQIIVNMSDEDFKHHTNSNGKNDFANWLRDILHKDSLAKNIESQNLKIEVLNLIEEELEKDKHLLAPDKFTRLLVKDFIFGLLIGLVLGLLLVLLN